MSTSTLNPFDLLGDDDSGDISQLLAAAAQKAAAAAAAVPKETENAPSGKGAAKLPSKTLPPAQAVREAKTETGRRGGRGGDRGGYGGDRGGDRGGYGGDRGGYGGDRGNARVGGGGGGGGGGYNRDQPKENSFRNSGFSGGQGGNEEADGGKSFEKRGGYNGPPRNSYRAPRRGESENGEVGNEEKPRRHYERRSGTGRGYEVKREGAGRGNWGTANDEITQETAEVVNETEKIVDAEKPSGEEEATDVTKETPATEAEVKEPEPEEDKEMTLQEYEKVLEEKRKALQALKTTEERKVDDKAFASMQALANKRDNDEVFAKLGSDKRKELAEKEEKAKKTPVSINEFLKPAEGERYYGGGGGRRGGRGGARGGRGPREGGSYGGGARTSYHVNAPKIEDPSQFPVLGAK